MDNQELLDSIYKQISSNVYDLLPESTHRRQLVVDWSDVRSIITDLSNKLIEDEEGTKDKG